MRETMLNANQLIGTHDVLMITLDTLRFDVAEGALARGLTPNLARVLPSSLPGVPGGSWELRHSPGNFTFAAHAAFFAGFLPTPVRPGKHPRLFAARFAGSETTDERTCVFDSPDIVSGLAARGYFTCCIGGVGFFNKQTPLGNVLPSLFTESHWSEELGVASLTSTERQVELACDVLRRKRTERVFLFINVSALHQPNCIFAPPATEDSTETQAAALAYVDRCLPPLFAALAARGPCLCLIMSDHGTAYGEDGYSGHRVGHPVVWNVPYAEFVLPAENDEK
jgi:hypothetical protein